MCLVDCYLPTVTPTTIEATIPSVCSGEVGYEVEISLLVSLPQRVGRWLARIVLLPRRKTRYTIHQLTWRRT